MRVFTETKWILLELSRIWWNKSNEYSLLLIISSPTAKENLSKPVTPRHITTRSLCAIKMTIKSSEYCSCIVLTNAKILNYKTVNFLVRKKSGQSPYFYFVTSEIQRKNLRSAHNHQNRFTDSSYYISIPLHNAIFSLVLYNVWQGLLSLTSHWLSASYFDEFIFFSG